MLVKLQLKSLPFSPTKAQVIFASGKRDERIETFIATHLDSIEKAFSCRELTFNHIPSLCKQIEDNSSFYAPYAAGSATASLQSDWALGYLADPEKVSEVSPMLIFFKEESVDACYGLTIDAEKAKTEHELLQQFADLAEEIEVRTTELPIYHDIQGIRYSLRANPRFEADEQFDAESRKLIAEVQERINKLRDNGLSAALVNALFHQEETPSPLRIDADYRLWLTAYGNVEIRMTPLVKAVFLLFVSHPEGILFKRLADYRTELRNIYAELRHCTLSAAEEESISRLTDPFNNSINEKCARIREAFCREMRPSLAEHYAINGQRGEAKKMSLPRELILWD